MKSVLVVNRNLAKAGHHQLHEATLQAMVEEVCGMIFGPKDEYVGR
jgi:hypothetical protein